MERDANSFILPPLVVGIADIMRLKRELDALYEYLHQSALRHASEAELKLPKTSRVLDELIRANKLDLLKREQYELTMAQLDAIEKKAPQIHLSFSSDPSSAFIVRIVEWLRQNIHPGVLVQVGLQPTLAAGCVVRTTNKQFDLSLKHHFEAAWPLLIQKIQEGVTA
jgi:F0F1-type ATP synthase delta subunit